MDATPVNQGSNVRQGVVRACHDTTSHILVGTIDSRNNIAVSPREFLRSASVLGWRGRIAEMGMLPLASKTPCIVRESTMGR